MVYYGLHYAYYYVSYLIYWGNSDKFCIRPYDAQPHDRSLFVAVQHPRPPGQCKVGSQQQRHSPAEHGLLSLRPGIQRQRHRQQPLSLQRQGTRRLHPRHLIPGHPRLRRSPLRSSHRSLDRPRSDGGEVLRCECVWLLQFRAN